MGGPRSPGWLAVPLTLGLLAAACVPPTRLVTTPPPQPCGQAAAPTPGPPPSRPVWFRPDDAGDRFRLARSCHAVGPVIVAGAAPGATRVDRLAIVSWNLDAGRGDVPALLADLRAGRLTAGAPGGVVLLLQEARRRPAGRPDVTTLAAAERLHLFYAPSVPHRRGGSVDGDRGNAILSSLPLADLAALELPYERQRRVAIGASVAAEIGGRAVPLRLVNVHLENRAGRRRAWIRSRAARRRQAEALAAWLPREGAVVLGGDLNTWSGGEAALSVLAAQFDRWAAGGADTRPTFGRWRIDHLFQRLPRGVGMTYRRLDDRYGSDHAPLLGVLTLQS